MASPRFLLSPSRALLHPAWLASLTVLALNDHVLKGSGLLPGWMTGKLSDFAGLLVAPLLLAAILRVRRLGPWVACHVVVGIGFAGIQLSAGFAAAWSTAMGWVGFPWVITMDATDLVALPALALSFWGLLPAMRRPAAVNVRRTAEVGVAAVGLLCCAATSNEPDCCDDDGDWTGSTTDEPEDEPEGDPWAGDIEADVYLSNATAQSRVVRVRALRDDVLLDCDVVEQAPGQRLQSSLFAPATSWTMPADTNLAVSVRFGGGSCKAVWVEADGLAPAVLFWSEGDPAWMSVPARGQHGFQGEVLLLDAGNGLLSLDGRPDLVYVSEAPPAAGEGYCAPQPDSGRLAWSSPVPWGEARIEAVEAGVDGCLAIDLSSFEQTSTWYLCVPEQAFPFVAGDAVNLRSPGVAEGEPGDWDGVEIVARDEDGVELATPRLVATTGARLPRVEGLELQTLPLYDCDLAVDEACGTVGRPLSLLVSGVEVQPAELYAGEPVTRLKAETRDYEISLMHAEERRVLDPACALGPDTLGGDVELIISQTARFGG